jgi:cyclin L
MGPLPRSPRDVGNAYTYLLSESSPLFKGEYTPDNKPSSYYQTETQYYDFQQRVLALEARILYALSFDTHVALPYPLAVTYLQTLDFLSQPKSTIAKRTMEYLNSSLLSPQMLYLTHQPHSLATAAIYNAARDIGAKMPECEWWEVFDVDREELGFLVVAMRSLEGWIRQQRDALPWFGREMIKRKTVEREISTRDLSSENGNNAAYEEDRLSRGSPP